MTGQFLQYLALLPCKFSSFNNLSRNLIFDNLQYDSFWIWKILIENGIFSFYETYINFFVTKLKRSWAKFKKLKRQITKIRGASCKRMSFGTIVLNTRQCYPVAAIKDYHLLQEGIIQLLNKIIMLNFFFFSSFSSSFSSSQK